eukprot:12726713-Alexandrium_andersonii.AAC.1
MARVGRRVGDYLADQACENVESAPAPAASYASGGVLVHGPAARAPEEAGARGDAAGQGGPASAGAPLAGPPGPMDER